MTNSIEENGNENDGEDFESDNSLELTSHPHEISMDTEIRISKEQSSVYELLRREKRGLLVLSPDFQRKDVWDIKHRSELIESILMGIPIPLIYLFEDESAVRQIIDGKQRISTLKKYINNEFALNGLSMYAHLQGKKFRDIPELLQSKIEDFQIHSYVIQPPTPEFVKFNIFERVNRGGINLNKQEMRHALYQGKATNLIDELADSIEFCKATGNGVKKERMKDRYLILRFISFYLLKTNILRGIEYRSDIDSFLATVMKYLNNQKDDILINHIKITCINGLSNSYEALGEDGFRFKGKEGSKKRPINMGLFEILVFAFSHIKINQDTNTNRINKYIEEQKIHFEDLRMFSGAIDTTDYVDVRFDFAFSLIEGININDNSD